MTETRQRTLLRTTVAIAVAGPVTGVVLVALVRGPAAVPDTTAAHALFVTCGLALVVSLAAREQATNRLVWVLAVAALGIGFFGFQEGARQVLDPDGPLSIVVITRPADLAPASAWLFAVAIAVSSAGNALLTTFGLLLFPDGRLPSKRWRPVSGLIAMGILVAAGLSIWGWSPHNTVAPDDQATFNIGPSIHAASTLVALAGLIVRFRRETMAERVRIKWVLWGLGVFVILMLIGLNTGFVPVTMAAFATLFAAYGIGIARHNLFDVNVVISRTLTYAVLAAVIGTIYVGVVVGIGSLLGSGDEPNPVLAITATALVAAAFQPARRRLQRLANRLVFGRRATPYEVLSDFSRRVAATGDSLLADVARSLVDGTAAERVAVTVDLEDGTAEAAAWPPDPAAAIETTSPAEPLRLPIVESGVRLGSLDLYVPPGQSLPDDEWRLAEHLAAGMGLALTNETLTERLAGRVDELRQSRRRLVAVQDDIRRRLERDLHDGAQQQLVALKVKLGLCRSLTAAAENATVTELVERLASDADKAVESLRDFARGVYPPLLESDGLEAAISGQLRRSHTTVDLHVDALGRYRREVESTVYFCILEALRETTGAKRVDVAQQNGSIVFAVCADGDGAESVGSEFRTPRIRDRIDALSGSVDVVRNPTGGITLSGTIPTAPEAPAATSS